MGLYNWVPSQIPVGGLIFGAIFGFIGMFILRNKYEMDHGTAFAWGFTIYLCISFLAGAIMAFIIGTNSDHPGIVLSGVLILVFFIILAIQIATIGKRYKKK